MRKKVDSRIRTLIENGVKLRHRTMLVIVGDKGKEQIPNLHYMLTNFMEKGRPSVLWCYKKDLGFTSHAKKRMKHIKRQIQRGLRDTDEDDPFELFISSTDIRYTFYKDSQKILGNTFGMCVLQDFEALSPNLLARTVETVEGGGLVVLLLQSLQSLRQLYSMQFEGLPRAGGRSRFAERFLLSLRDCPRAAVLDDTLTLLPLTAGAVRSVVPTAAPTPSTALATLQSQVAEQFGDGDAAAVRQVMGRARTAGQAAALLRCVESVAALHSRATVTLTAARGRGKSAALGLAVAAAVSFGYANVFVSAPAPENLRTFFAFVCQGFDALGYKETVDYDLIRSTNPDFANAIVRINIFRAHRQTIQYVQPHDHQKISQAELLVIDEAAAIPLPIVKKLLGPYLVFLSSTINGYEGTGRSLSLKLIDQLREQNARGSGGRALREVTLEEPIRYAAGDPVETWLQNLLCLDAQPAKGASRCPLPALCELYYVNRDTLFSYHKASEDFLQRLVALFVASHYKNSPDDLLLLSDAPEHHLFVLLGPVTGDQRLPDVLCAVQVALEGKITRETVVQNLTRGKGAAGDLIPWTLSQQFQDPDFPSLSGGRVVRISTHPEYQKMGYGSRALELLAQYFSGQLTSLSESLPDAPPEVKDVPVESGTTLQTEDIRPRSKEQLPPLLVTTGERPAERLHYLGVSFGVTPSLYGFWKKSGFAPVYLRQTTNDLTGEHTCIMLKHLPSEDLEVSCSSEWLEQYYLDFRRRFISLLPIAFREFPGPLGLSILNPKRGEEVNVKDKFTKEDLDRDFSSYDVKRLESYSRNLVDFHVILDLLPSVARLYFTERLPLSLSAGQAAILLGMGLQCKTVDDVAAEMTLPVNQVLALFNKALRKVLQFFRALQEESHSKALPTSAPAPRAPVAESLKTELAANVPSVVSLPSKRPTTSPGGSKKKKGKKSR